MQQSTLKSLRLLAPDLLVGKLPYPIPVYCQHAVSILKILDDGEWHTAAKIAEELGIGKKCVRDILRTCKEHWGLDTANPRGWMLAKKDLDQQLENFKPKTIFGGYGVNDFSKELNELASVIGKAKTPDSVLEGILKILAKKTTEELFEILEELEKQS